MPTYAVCVGNVLPSGFGGRKRPGGMSEGKRSTLNGGGVGIRRTKFEVMNFVQRRKTTAVRSVTLHLANKFSQCTFSVANYLAV